MAEDVSGMPGCAASLADCGMGFDYRMAMGEPDYWFHLAEKVRDEDWNMHGLYHALTDKRADEQVVSYVESHDQALVGGKTFFFQLVDKAIYWGMGVDQHGVETDRGVALHKMARLATFACSGGAYLNFMGNEFGHPEWIDFPREGNGWSYAYARRQWSLADNPDLRYGALQAFDAAMVHLLRRDRILEEPPQLMVCDEEKKVLIFSRKNCIFAFNFNPSASFADYGFPAPSGTYGTVLHTDAPEFDGFDRLREAGGHETVAGTLRLYLPSRTALVLEKRK